MELNKNLLLKAFLAALICVFQATDVIACHCGHMKDPDSPNDPKATVQFIQFCPSGEDPGKMGPPNEDKDSIYGKFCCMGKCFPCIIALLLLIVFVGTFTFFGMMFIMKLGKGKGSGR